MQLAILLQEIGQGPFSHSTEALLDCKIMHEEISLEVMKFLNLFVGKPHYLCFIRSSL